MSALDIPARLAELFEPALLEDLCKGFVAQHRVGLRVFDQHIGQLAEVVRDGGLAPWIFNRPEGRRRFVAFVDELKALRLDPQECVIKEEPVTGCRYMVLPVTWNHEVLGKVVCGPYLQPDFQISDMDLAEALEDVPRCPDAGLQSRLRFLVLTIDLVCHSGYRALLTSSLHLVSITRAHEDLQRTNAELAESNIRLAAQNDRLRELDAMKSDFLSTVSHELRTPLTSIIGYSEMLVEELAGPITDEQREYLRTILERALSLLSLIEGVLAFSRAEYSARPERPHTLAVQPALVVAEAVSSVRPQAMKGLIQLEVDVPPSLPPILTDAAGLRQALINLLGNAVKFTDPGGVVRVNAVASARAGQPVMRFSVTDTGIGISAEAVTHIFEPFFQVDGSSTRSYGGTGLGLSIVKRFVEGQGGTLDVETAPGVGSTFTFDLPLTVQRAAVHEERPSKVPFSAPATPPTGTPQVRRQVPAWAEREVNADRDSGGRGGGGHRG